MTWLEWNDLYHQDKELPKNYTATVWDSSRLVSIKDGIARDSGLHKFQAGEMVEFARGVKGMALILENEKIRIAIVGTICTLSLKERDIVTCTGGWESNSTC
jgi:F-type H+-transporting ATPase subunit alpha